MPTIYDTVNPRPDFMKYGMVICNTRPAPVWFNSLAQDYKHSFPPVKKLFIAEYCDYENIPKLSSEEAAFYKLKLQPSQLLEDFHTFVLKKGKRLGKPGRDMTFRFIEDIVSAQLVSDISQQASQNEACGTYNGSESELLLANADRLVSETDISDTELHLCDTDKGIRKVHYSQLSGQNTENTCSIADNSHSVVLEQLNTNVVKMFTK
ncbi:hypothetical protein KUTeg_022030 [Tegillarca granosa]|uniref:Uncharacterized protein n=1 Tax=Tegillarca granosa TaxID=220873 RepID=A0ABQ9E7Y1_TEGGR|nr:hypothetical protein KUTeg_022030 [Tegillarca granosa]